MRFPFAIFFLIKIQTKNTFCFGYISSKKKKKCAYESGSKKRESRQKKSSSCVWSLYLFTVSKNDIVRSKSNEWKNMKWKLLWASYSFHSTIYQLLFVLAAWLQTKKRRPTWAQAMKVETVLQCNYYRTNNNKWEQ